MNIKYLLTILIISSSLLSAPPGLYNFQNTCYLNSSLQNLFNCQALRQYLVGKKTYLPNTFASSFRALIQEMQKGLPLLDKKNRQLNDFVLNYAYPVMGGCDQQDATEFIEHVLNLLMEQDPAYQAPQFKDPNTLKREHAIGKLFSLGQTLTVNCPSINFTRTRPQIDYEIRLNPQVRDYTTVAECLQNYFAAEKLDTYKLDLDEAEKTQRPDLIPHNQTYIHDCTHRLALQHTSEFVIIALKRFDNNRRKLGQDITVEPIINFAPYMANPTLPTPNYELIGSIVQMGSLSGGHYVAYVKSNGSWYLCNDEVVKKISWQEMQTDKHQGIHQSYILFYQRQNGQRTPNGITGKCSKITARG